MADLFAITNWNINANCEPGELRIERRTDCEFSGVVFGQPIFGFWDNPAQKITFMRLTNPGDPESYQVFTGYLMGNENETCNMLAGSFESFAHGSPAGSCLRSVFGWFASGS